MNKKRISVFGFILCFVIFTQAQNIKRVWSLEECIQYAIKHNIELEQIAQDREASEIELNTAKNNYLPTLNASTSQNFDFGRSPSKTGVIVDQNSANTSMYLQLNVSVFDGFLTKNSIEAKKWSLKAITASLQAAKESLLINIASYYLQVLYYKELFSVTKMNLDITNELMDRTQIMVNEGKVPESLLYDVKAQLAKEEVLLIEAESNVSLALLDLTQCLDLESLEEFDFDIAIPEIENTLSEYINALLAPEYIYEIAVYEKPQIKEKQFLLISQKKNLKSIQANYYPTLNFFATYSNGYYHYYNQEVLNISFSDQLEQNVRRTLGFTLTIPIFNRFSVRNNIRKARINIHGHQLQVDAAKKMLYKEIQQAYSNAIAAQEKYKSSCNAVEAAKEAYRYATERYDAGKSTVFEYNEAKIKYTNSLSEQAQSKYNFIFRAKILDFYFGVPLRL